MPDPLATRGRIVVAGDVIDDIVVVPRSEIRRDTDTPSTIRFRPGGSASNTAAWLGSLGSDVDFVGIVGAADVERHVAQFAASGVRAQLAAHPDLPTGTIVVIVDDQQRAMLTERGANADFDGDLVTDELLDAAGLLYLTGHTVFGRDDTSSIERLVARARARGLEVAVDPGSAGYLADRGTETFQRVFAAATVLLPSLDEGVALTGLTDPAEVALALAAGGALVVMTMGIDGVIVCEGGALTRVPAVAATVTDPTGAGDAFAAGFLHEWVRSRDAVAAASAGAEVASRSVTIVGGRPD